MDWSQIVHEHGPMVWRTVRRLVSNAADAADCFQCTFISALELSAKQAIRNWPGLLRRLATVRALDFLRRRQRQSNRTTSLQENSVLDRNVVSPVQAAQAGELAEHLRQALGDLDSQQAQVFCLACLEDCSYQEIADQLGLTVNHVGVLLNRARRFLQEKLRSHEPGVRGQESEVR